MSRVFFVFCFVFCALSLSSQTVEISGRVESKSNIESIHVINKTSQVFTITDTKGNFKITAKLLDTIQFSSIQHKLKEVIINKDIISSKIIHTRLEEKINELEEVTVGKVLTGNLLSDIENIEGKPPVNFYDVGIPGYTGKIATQSERRLAQAGEFKPEMLIGLLTGGVSLDPIINGITGRTKMLKQRVELEERETLIRSIKARLLKDFLLSNPLEEARVMDFFYFCSEDEHFIKYCKNKSDFDILVFLRHKHRQYIKNLESVDD